MFAVSGLRLGELRDGIGHVDPALADGRQHLAGDPALEGRAFGLSERIIRRYRPDSLMTSGARPAKPFNLKESTSSVSSLLRTLSVLNPSASHTSLATNLGSPSRSMARRVRAGE